MLELSIVYIFCFSLNLLLDYAKTLDLDAYILKAFLKNFIDARIGRTGSYSRLKFSPLLQIPRHVGCIRTGHHQP